MFNKNSFQANLIALIKILDTSLIVGSLDFPFISSYLMFLVGFMPVCNISQNALHLKEQHNFKPLKQMTTQEKNPYKAHSFHLDRVTSWANLKYEFSSWLFLISIISSFSVTEPMHWLWFQRAESTNLLWIGTATYRLV